MITDIRFYDGKYQKALAYISDDPEACYLADPIRWQKILSRYGEDYFLRVVVATLSHESMHSVIETHESEDASVAMDNPNFDEGLTWELACF
jgi:hypothetical protein